MRQTLARFWKAKAHDFGADVGQSRHCRAGLTVADDAGPVCLRMATGDLFDKLRFSLPHVRQVGALFSAASISSGDKHPITFIWSSNWNTCSLRSTGGPPGP